MRRFALCLLLFIFGTTAFFGCSHRGKHQKVIEPIERRTIEAHVKGEDSPEQFTPQPSVEIRPPQEKGRKPKKKQKNKKTRKQKDQQPPSERAPEKRY